jgi:hypothetical protein
MYASAKSTGAKSWNQIEAQFLQAMWEFDSSVSSTVGRQDMSDEEKTALSGDLQNGKGDFFNDLLALLLENCSGIASLATRPAVSGLIVRRHNLDGVYPPKGPIGFLLEAKMTGTPKHVNSPKQKISGRPGSADLDKRVKELAFKSIDLKGEYSRLRTAEGHEPTTGPGGDLTTWLRSSLPRIHFFLAVRVIDDADFARTLQWARTAQQVVDSVGLFCFENHRNGYRRRAGVPAELELERVLYRACTDLQAIDKQTIGTKVDRMQ